MQAAGSSYNLGEPIVMTRLLPSEVTEFTQEVMKIYIMKKKRGLPPDELEHLHLVTPTFDGVGRTRFRSDYWYNRAVPPLDKQHVPGWWPTLQWLCTPFPDAEEPLSPVT